ncbi:MAG: SET domain-containing protein-lysine N-methyltransferase, partial [Candidatus Hydrogenedentota bacterium]
EYIGEKISHEESERRSELQEKKAKKTGEGSVYIFNLNSKWDLDGNIPENLAKYINHSCSPNAEAIMTSDYRIYIVAKKKIKKGEEITFDYGFSIDNYQKHPCHCGSKNCVGYIVSARDKRKLRKYKSK